MAYELIGDDMYAVAIKMKRGETSRVEAGAMMYMSANMVMAAKMKGCVLVQRGCGQDSRDPYTNPASVSIY